MRTVYKYPIMKNLVIPSNYKTLRVGNQNGESFLWAEVDTEGPRSNINLVILGTGQEIPDHANYIGGYSDGPFEWHVYELE